MPRPTCSAPVPRSTTPWLPRGALSTSTDPVTDPSSIGKKKTARASGPFFIAGSEMTSVVMAAVAMHVPVRQLFLGGFPHIDDGDVEMQVATRHRVVEVDIDNAHAALLDGDGPV